MCAAVSDFCRKHRGVTDLIFPHPARAESGRTYTATKSGQSRSQYTVVAYVNNREISRRANIVKIHWGISSHDHKTAVCKVNKPNNGNVCRVPWKCLGMKYSIWIMKTFCKFGWNPKSGQNLSGAGFLLDFRKKHRVSAGAGFRAELRYSPNEM